MTIRTQFAKSIAQAPKTDLPNRLLSRYPVTSTRRRSKRFQQITTASSYAAALIIVATIASLGYRSPIESSEVAQGASQASIEVTKPSVDQIVATDLAASLAETAKLPVATNVSNLAISLAAKSDLAQTDDDLISKPQIFELSASDREFRSYKTKAGDSAEKVAAQFNVSANTIKWANDLVSDALEPGKTLTIPPIDGVVYTVSSGDTPKSLADRYRTNEQRIILYNDLELTKLKAGQRIFIPGGVLPSSERPGYTPPASNSFFDSGSYGAVSQFTSSASVGNRYDFGYCTWYAYNRRAELGRPVGSFWGNATTWASIASGSGFRVDNTPRSGAILQSSGGWGGYGHVAVVESVGSDGSVTVSEMNYAGWNVISTRTIPAGQAGSYNYIH